MSENHPGRLVAVRDLHVRSAENGRSAEDVRRAYHGGRPSPGDPQARPGAAYLVRATARSDVERIGGVR